MVSPSHSRPPAGGRPVTQTIIERFPEKCHTNFPGAAEGPPCKIPPGLVKSVLNLCKARTRRMAAARADSENAPGPAAGRGEGGRI